MKLDLNEMRRIAGLNEARQSNEQTVGGLMLVFQNAIAQLQKLPPNTPIVHVLMPNGRYGGDAEDTFKKITIHMPGPGEDEPQGTAEMALYY